VNALSLFFWGAFGCLIGWVATMLTSELSNRRKVTYVVIGALGGIVGGWGGSFLDPLTTPYHSSTTDIMFATFGASAFVFLINFAADKLS